MEPRNLHFKVFVQPVIIVYLPSIYSACYLVGMYAHGSDRHNLALVVTRGMSARRIFCLVWTGEDRAGLGDSKLRGQAQDK